MRLRGAMPYAHKAFHVQRQRRVALRRKLAAVVLLLSAAAFATTNRIDLDGLVLAVSTSPTAQTFHVVDQLSQWDMYAHKQYVRWAESENLLDVQDRQFLARHAELRKKRGWGHGFEQAFLVDGSIENAAARAIAAGILSPAEANAERDILLHFSPKLQPLFRRCQSKMEALQQQLVSDQPRLSALVQQLAAFSEVRTPPTVPVFLVANVGEHSGGGEANGGRLVVEVPSPDAIGILLHESLHWLLEAQEGAIRSASESAGLDFTILTEGIAYALYPGIIADTDRGDILVEQLVRRELGGASASDAFVKFYQVACVIRPLLRAALKQNETITVFLPKAAAKWRSVSPPSP
jgi:hypothetical protein